MTDINVVARTQRIVVDPASKSVSVINLGPQGIPGPPGVGGTAAGTLVVDNGDWFVSANAEDVLQEIGANLDIRDSTILDHEARIDVIEPKIVDNDQRIAVVETRSSDNEQDILNHHNEQAILNSALTTANSANAAAIVILDTRLTDAEAFETRIVVLESGQLTINATLSTQSQRIDDAETLTGVLNGMIDQLILDDVAINNRCTAIEARLDALENPNP